MSFQEWDEFVFSAGIENQCFLYSLETFCDEKNKKILYRTYKEYQGSEHPLQFYEDEWLFKQEIVKSMIEYRTKKTKRKIDARKCKIKELSSSEAKSFFEETHISGYVPSRKNIGLVYKDEVICALGLRIPIQKKYGNICEISRFSTKKFIKNPGGFSKLMKYAEEWARQQGFEGILTYADLRFGKGLVYEKNGFTFIENTSPGYWYSSPKEKKRYFRFKFRAQKEPKITEKNVALAAGVYASYDCGHRIYLKKFHDIDK